MKKLFWSSLVVLAATATGLAQEKPTEYLYKDGVQVSAFGGFLTEFSTVNNRFATSLGAGGGVILNRRLHLGLYGLGYTGRDLPGPEAKPDAKLAFGHVGLWTGYTFMPEKAVHFTLGSKIGWGGLAWYDHHDEEVPVDGTFVWTPEAGIEFNVAEFLKIGLTGGYRLVYGVDLAGASEKALRSPSAAVSFKFGLY